MGLLTARQIKAICREGEPRCACGGRDFARSFQRFPMAHVSRCVACGREVRCELKPTPPRPPRPAAPHYPYPC